MERRPPWWTLEEAVEGLPVVVVAIRCYSKHNVMIRQFRPTKREREIEIEGGSEKERGQHPLLIHVNEIMRRKNRSKIMLLRIIQFFVSYCIPHTQFHIKNKTGRLPIISQINEIKLRK